MERNIYTAFDNLMKVYKPNASTCKILAGRFLGHAEILEERNAKDLAEALHEKARTHKCNIMMCKINTEETP